MVAEHFRTAFDKPCITDNRPGAGGTIGTDIVAKATDGHTLGVTINGPITTAKALYPELPYDPARDLAFVSLLVQAPQLLVVGPSLPVSDLEAFIAHASRAPTSLAYGSVGPGSAGHLAMEELKARTEIQLVHVPYKGFPDAVIDLIGGRIHAMFITAGGILPQIEAGKVRALAVTSAARIERAPQVPTVAEAGLPDAVGYAWIGLIAPAATPSAQVDVLAREARTALTLPARQATLERAGFEVVASGPEEFKRFAVEETRRWGGLVQRLGITMRD
jgi:tripartite-type tricarboxylate transporter receptor subunit TctC